MFISKFTQTFFFEFFLQTYFLTEENPYARSILLRCFEFKLHLNSLKFPSVQNKPISSKPQLYHTDIYV